MKTKKPLTKQLPASTSMMVVADSIKKKAQPLIKQIEALPIKTKADYDKAAKLMATIKEYGKEARLQEESLTEPAKNIIKSAQEIFKPFRTKIQELEGMVKIRMIEFTNKQAQLSEKIGSDFESGKIKKLSTVVSKQNHLMDTSSDHAQVRKVWKLTIVNELLIPRQYLMPNETVIKEVLKNGQKVPGCLWQQENTIAI